MAKTYEQALEIKKSLADDYRIRHEEQRLLRDFWQGKYWDRVDADASGISSVFRDLTSKSSDVGPDIKVVHNVIQEICVKYQTFLSPVPQIRVYTDPPESTKRRAQATKKERYLYGTWSENRIPKKLASVGWYLPLMGDCFLGIWPDFEKNMPRMLVRSPEKAFPIPNTEGGLDGVIFSWEIKESQAIREFSKYIRRSDRPANILNRVTSAVKSKPADPLVEILEYSDGECVYRWVDGIQVAGIEHKLGFNLFDQVQFIQVPDEVWGHGAVEQYVGMNEMQNAMYSLVFQGMIENIFPHLVLEDPSKAPELIDKGPGSVLPLNPGGKAYYLAPPVQTLQVQEGFMGMNNHNIRVGSGMPEVQSGQSPASSIVTGKAINELQGAATGSTIEMVQGVGIGLALVSWNEKAITMQQQLFKDDQANLYGNLPVSKLDVNPKAFALTVRGRELIGSPRNEVIFSPHMSDHEKLVMMLQGLGAGLWSKKHARENLGVVDNDQMVEEILGEVVEDGALQTLLQLMQNSADPAMADQVENKAVSFLEGGKSLATPTLHPLIAQQALPAGPGGPPGGPQGLPPGGAVGPVAPGGTGEAKSPPFRLPPGSPPPGGVPPEAQGQLQGGDTVSLNDVAAAFQGLQGVKGRVFLVGEIVATGQTSGDIEVALTDDDRDAIGQGLAQYASRLVFHHAAGEPQEAHVEVTPGKVPQQGGPAEAQVA